MDATSREAPLERPPLSPCCGARSWWNGKRIVLIVASRPDGCAARPTEQCRARCKCTACRHGFTLYSAGEYPQRMYQPDVVAQVVAARAIGAQSASVAAKSVGASATSARRWTCWIAELIEPRDVISLAAQLDPHGVHGDGLSGISDARGGCAIAARVISALETLGAALIRAGATLASRTGLGRVLEWQYVVHRVWVPLVSRGGAASPRMVISVGDGAAIRSGADARPRRSG